MQINGYNNKLIQAIPQQASRNTPADFVKTLAAAHKNVENAVPQPVISNQTMPLLHQDEINFFNRSFFTESYARYQSPAHSAAGSLALQV